MDAFLIEQADVPRIGYERSDIGYTQDRQVRIINGFDCFNTGILHSRGGGLATEREQAQNRIVASLAGFATQL